MTEAEIRIACDRLIAFLKNERKQSSSCTPDIIERFDRAIDEHLEANGEPPLRRIA